MALDVRIQASVSVIAIVLDVVMFVVLLYFASGLRWSKEQDRASIVGFGIMIGTVLLSVVCILF